MNGMENNYLLLSFDAFLNFKFSPETTFSFHNFTQPEKLKLFFPHAPDTEHRAGNLCVKIAPL